MRPNQLAVRWIKAFWEALVAGRKVYPLRRFGWMMRQPDLSGVEPWRPL